MKNQKLVAQMEIERLRIIRKSMIEVLGYIKSSAALEAINATIQALEMDVDHFFE